ncbi:MAG: DUF2865 domain-containing protein [Pseudomonadota bacterium]
MAHPAPASANNPFQAIFSLFAPKKKAPARPRVLVPGPRGQVLIDRNGRRIFNPFLTPGAGDQSQRPAQRPLNMGRRTMCVRLCDGYYWPMRRGGSNASLMSDSQKCESQCSSGAQLFILRSSTDKIGTMRNLAGQSYNSLANAFAYRSSYNAQCTCRAQPWSERARLRHDRYAAVGREKAAIALKSVKLDLRATLTPSRKVRAAARPVTRLRNVGWDVELPVRRPKREASEINPVPGGANRSADPTERSYRRDVETTAQRIARLRKALNGGFSPKRPGRPARAIKEVRAASNAAAQRLSTRPSRHSQALQRPLQGLRGNQSSGSQAAFRPSPTDQRPILRTTLR